MRERGDDEMIQMEYPKLPLDGLTPEEQIKALKRQVDILTDNLQIVLNSIEDDVGNVDNTSDKDKPISDATQEALDEISEALDTKVSKAGDTMTGDLIMSGADIDLDGQSLKDFITVKSTRVSNYSVKRSELFLWKQGNIVQFVTSGDFVNLPAGASPQYVTIPEEYRPQTTQYFRCVNNGTMIVMYVATSGAVTFYNYGSAITSATNGVFQGMWIA